MAESSSSSSSDWKSSLRHALRRRNDRETRGYALLVQSHARLLAAADALRSQNVQLTLEAERLRGLGSPSGGGGGSDSDKSAASAAAVTALEHKIYKLQEDLTDSLRRKGENAQKIIDLNNELQERDKELTTLRRRLAELQASEEKAMESCKALEETIEDQKRTMDCVRDEHQVLQIAYCQLNEQCTKLKEENLSLVQRWMEKKRREADDLNADNDQKAREKAEKIRQDLAEAAKEQNPVDLLAPDDSGDVESSFPAYGFTVSIPTRVSHHFVAHEGEVNAVRFSPHGKILATGGSDRKVKLWKDEGGKADLMGTLTGSNAGVMSLDFDSEENFILAASNDFASRIWCLTDHRLRHTLTGHSGKVMSAKFLGDSSKVVSGSHDRTLKLWDLRSKACFRTIFAGSSCNDIVASDAVATNIISGHFDKRVRFWDTRTDNSSSEISVQGRVTSLDLHPGKVYLLVCSRDDTVKMIDLRMNQVCSTYCSEGFKTCCDWTRAVLSPDGQYVTVGSQDDNIYVWNSTTLKLETVLKEHSHAVVACHWHPSGSKFASCDKNKNCVLWTDF